MDFKNPEQLLEWKRHAWDASATIRNDLARDAGEDACFYEGLQWIKAGRSDPTWIKANVVYGVNAQELRVQANEITRLVQKVAASTKPNQLEIDAVARAGRIADEATSAAHERFASMMVDRCRYIAAASRANFMRTITGTWGIGLTVRAFERMISGEVRPDMMLSAFDFDPSELVLDPHQTSRDLEEHEHVGWEGVWTARRIREVYGLQLDETKLKTIGELAPTKVAAAEASERRMYAHHARHSATKGARVCQLLFKGDSGVFDRMYVCVEVDGKDQVVNMDNPVNPFGGSGMPFQLLCGHWRADGIWGMSDVSMMKEDQRLRNLVMTLWVRALQRYGHSRVVVDRRAFGPRLKTDEEISQKFTNRPFEITVVDGGDRSRNIPPVTYVSQPEPPHFALDLIRQKGQDMVDKAHKTGGNFGPSFLKSHVTDSAAQRAFDDAGEVHDNRVEEDVAAHLRMVAVMHATGVRMASVNTPTVAQWLVRDGFDVMDMGAIAQSDPQDLPVRFHVRESSVRRRPHRQRAAELNNALSAQALTPMEWRMAMAGTLEAPLSDMDAKMYDAINKQVVRIVQGAPWEPIPMGIYVEHFLGSCRRALLEDTTPPDAADRLRQAMMAQIQLEQALAPTTTMGGVDSQQTTQPIVGEQFSPADLLESMAVATQ